METAYLQKEQALIRELKKHSRKAFDEIYRLYARRLLAYCKQYTKNMEDAEEIVQDVFVQLWNNRVFIRQEETLRSLLFLMSKHRLIDAYRSHLNAPVYEDYVDYQSSFAIEDTTYHLEYEEFRKELQQALATLPTTQRHVIELSRLRELSNKEIAEKLSLSEQTVKNQLSLGLKALRGKLKHVFPLGILYFLWLIK